MEELKEENPKYSQVDLKIIDEGLHPDIAEKYDYYYVPTYYIDGKKVHEGVATRDIVRNIFKEAVK